MNQTDKGNHFTILIPTRERCDTLVHTLSSTLSQDYDNFTILVSDNASLDETRQTVESFKDPRIQYINTGRRVSMSENWEFAMNHISDGWVTVLGDDDAMLPGTLKLVDELIKETGVKAIRSNDCDYVWPGVKASYYGSINMSCRRGYELRNSEKFLQKVMDGKISYTELPVLYNGGFVSFELIRKAKQVAEKLFNSMNPDLYSGIVFSHLTDNYLYSREPLAVNGASIHSGGTAAFEKKKRIQGYNPAEKFLSEPNIPFHSDLPLMPSGKFVRSIPVLVYESYLQAKAYHKFKSISVTKEDQLATALRVARPDPAEVQEWAALFCSKHNVRMPQRYIIRCRVVLAALTDLPIRLRRRLTSIKLDGSIRMPLQNVSEASLVAGSIKELQPPFLQRITSRRKRKTTDRSIGS